MIFLMTFRKALLEPSVNISLSFVNSSGPFLSYIAEEGGAMVYGPGKKRQNFVKSKKAEGHGKRSTIFKLAETSSLEKLSDAWGVFLRGQ